MPEVRAGDDLAGLLVDAVRGAGLPLVVVLSSKVVSKVSGLVVHGVPKEDVVAGETVRVVVERRSGERTTQVVESVAGPVMAAAGVDASNTGADASDPADDDALLVLPADCDGVAARLRGELLVALGAPPDAPLGVVVSDTAGRAWRGGLTDLSLGSAGIVPLLDHRGGRDHDGRPLEVTVRCLADELAGAADLVKGKAAGVPAALVGGAPAAWFDADAPGSRTVVRTGPGDWFALGHVEAVRAALGVLPGSPDAVAVGIPPVGEDTLSGRVARVVSVAVRGEDEGVGADVEVGPAGARVTVTADDAYAVGRLAARLEVAAASESLRANVIRSGHGVVVELSLSRR